MFEDRYGYTLTTGSSVTAEAYVRGADRLLSADTEIEAAFREAVAASRGPCDCSDAAQRSTTLRARPGDMKEFRLLFERIRAADTD